MNWTTKPNYLEMPLAQLKTVGREGLSIDDFTIVRDRLLTAWDADKAALETAKANEMEMRKIFVAFASDQNKTSGTENVDLGNGYAAKIVKKENYGFVKDESGKIDKRLIDSALDHIEENVDGGRIIAERLVKWTPDLSLTEYKQLPPEAKAIIDKVIVVTSGAPTLEIKAPAGSK